mgnify:FL=1|jgi:hypothetical protein
MSDNKRHFAIIIFALVAILRCVVGIVYYAERIWGFAAKGVSESVLAPANAVAAVLFMLAAIWLTVVEYRDMKQNRTQKQ